MQQSSQIKKLLIKLVYFIPFPLIMISVCLYADPARIFDGGRYESEIVKVLVSGKNAGNIRNHNDRLLQKFYAENINQAPDILAIGSSRSMQISQDLFPNETFHNSSVPNATLEDLMTVIEFYLEKGLKPKKVVLGIEPWIFNADNGHTRWKDFRNEYLAAYHHVTNKTGKTKKDFKLIDDKYLTLLSPSYFQKSLYILFRPKSVGEFYITDKSEADEPIKMSDGSYVYGKDMRNLTAEQVLNVAKKRIEDKAIGYEKFNPQLVDLFEQYISYLQDNGIEVIFYLGPYHPATYKQILESSKYDIVCDVEIYLRTFASEKGIKIIGSYDPAVADVGIEDFHDWVHARREAVARIFHKFMEN